MQNRDINQDKAVFHFNDSTDFQSCYKCLELFADSIKPFYKKPNNQLITILLTRQNPRIKTKIRDNFSGKYTKNLKHKI